MASFFELINSNYGFLRKIAIVLLMSFFLIDNLIVYLTLRRKYILNYWYIDSHQKYGYIKITILKSFLILLVFKFLFYPLGRPSDPFLFIGFYIIVIIISTVKFIQSRLKKDNKGRKGRVGDWQDQSPLIKPYVRFSRIRFSDVLHIGAVYHITSRGLEVLRKWNR